MDKATIGRFLLQAAVWGSSFTFIKMSLEGLSPSQVVLSRLVLGALVLTLFAAARRVPLPRSAGTWGHIAVAGVFGNVAPFLLLSYGEQGTGAGVAGVLVGGTPLLTLLIATVALPSERGNRRTLLGFLTGFVGVALVIAPWHDALGSAGARFACFCAALSYAAGYVYVRKFLSPRGLAPLGLAAAQLIAAAVLMAVCLPFLQWRSPVVDGRIILAIAVLGVLSTGLANVLYFRLIADVGATTAAAVDYIVPVFALLFSVVVLSEPLTWNLIAGGLVVLLGMAVAEGRLTQLGRHQAPAEALVAEPPAEVAGVPASTRGGAGDASGRS